MVEPHLKHYILYVKNLSVMVYIILEFALAIAFFVNFFFFHYWHSNIFSGARLSSKYLELYISLHISILFRTEVWPFKF